MILAVEAVTAEEHAFDKANAEGMAKVMSAMGMAAKDPLVWLAEVTEDSTYPSHLRKKDKVGVFIVFYIFQCLPTVNI